MWVLARPDAAAALDDPKVRASLPRYVSVVRGKLPARYVITGAVAVDTATGVGGPDPRSPVGDLWALHGEALAKGEGLRRRLDSGNLSVDELRKEPGKPAGISLLRLKHWIGERVLEACVLCERRCRSNRFAGKGYCGIGSKMLVSSCFDHLGEEPEIVPSFTVCGRH